MKECLIDGLLDTLKLIPYLLITFLVLEYIEHKFSSKNQKILTKNKKYGPILGGILGAMPQCGFSSMAANLYSAKVITIGTLIAVFLSTSDEMLPIMISEKVDITFMLSIIVFKLLVGIIIGFIVDLIYHKKEKDTIEEICEHDHCSCKEEGIILSSIKHTFKISSFVLLANILINLIIYYIGEENLAQILLNKNILTYFASSLIGLIPNCSGSIIITELYLSYLITLGTMLSGLLTGSGLGILLLFRSNKNKKENIIILLTIYFIGVILGILVDLVI